MPSYQLYSLRFFLVLAALSSFPPLHAKDTSSCVHISNSLKRQNPSINLNHLVTVRPVSSASLSVCLPRSRTSDSKTCCTADLERELLEFSTRDLAKELRTNHGQLIGFLTEQYEEFRRILLMSLIEAEEATELRFADAFALMADKNETILAIRTLFGFLRNSSGFNLDFISAEHALPMDFKAEVLAQEIAEKVGEFFAEIFSPAFHCLAAPAQGVCVLGLRELGVEEKRKECFKKHFDTIRPFGKRPRDIGRRLAAGILRVRSAVEMWLWMKRDLENRLAKLEENLGRGCLEEFTRMKYCPLCSDTVFKPKERALCVGYCSGVITGCLESAGLGEEFQKQWKTLLEQSLREFSANEFGAPPDSAIAALPRDLESAIAGIIYGGGKGIAEEVVEKCGKTPEKKLTEDGVSLRKEPEEIKIESDQTDGTSLPPQKEEKQTRVWPEFKKAVSELTELYSDWFGDTDKRLCDGTEMTDSNCWNGRGIGMYTDTLTLGETGGSAVGSAKVSAGKNGQPVNTGPVPPEGDINLDEKMRNLKKILAQIDGKNYKKQPRGGSDSRRSSSMLVRSTDSRRYPDTQDPREKDREDPWREKSSDDGGYVREGSGGGRYPDQDDSDRGLRTWYPTGDSDDEDTEGSGSGDGPGMEPGLKPLPPPRKGPSESGISPVWPDKKEGHKIVEEHPDDRKSGDTSGASESVRLSWLTFSLAVFMWSRLWRFTVAGS